MLDPHRLPCEIPAARPAPKPIGAKREVNLRWVLPATILGSSLSFVDASVVNVALPAIQQGLQAPLATVQWVVNGYMLMLASLILLGGSAGDRFGQRQVFLLGLIGFAVASLGCGLAPNAAWLIAARLAQGIAAALLVPASLAIIGIAYTGEARGRAIGTWAAAAALTTASGPLLGGWLVDAVGWRSIFFINLPIAALATILALKLPAGRNDESGEALDMAGAVLAVLALGLLSYGLIALGEGRRLTGAAVAMVALLAGGLFVRRERRAAAPMMPLRLFHSRDFAGANGLTVLLYAALSGALFLLPFLLIETHGYSATAAGAAFLPFSAIMGVGSRWSGGLGERLGARPLLVLGPALTAAGCVLLGLSGSTANYWIGYLPGLVVVGIGMTLAVAPLTATVFDSAPEDRGGVASGINNAAARAGGLLAVAALGLAFGGADAAGAGSGLAEAYRLVMLGAAALAALGAGVAALTIAPRRAAPAHR
ncbi:MAG TPA: MFS transporter [Ferrovibrio sp.]|jgi:EmrB/QacA subfamily drug resistance transporter|uniref:MFS transporter n=1 Tax=Ferrovibrio sp. TaxID=1917215 RepID=UPI002ED1D2C9